MGSNINSGWTGHKREGGYQLDIPNIRWALFFNDYKKHLKMADIKAALWIANFLGIPLSVFAFLLYIETWKGNIIFALSVIYLIARIYFYIQKNIREIRMKDIHIKDKEIDLDDKKESHD